MMGAAHHSIIPAQAGIQFVIPAKAGIQTLFVFGCWTLGQVWAAPQPTAMSGGHGDLSNFAGVTQSRPSRASPSTVLRTVPLPVPGRN